MKEQAEREQRSIDDVVAERYGVRICGTNISHLQIHPAHMVAQIATALIRMVHIITISVNGEFDLSFLCDG